MTHLSEVLRPLLIPQNPADRQAAMSMNLTALSERLSDYPNEVARAIPRSQVESLPLKDSDPERYADHLRRVEQTNVIVMNALVRRSEGLFSQLTEVCSHDGRLVLTSFYAEYPRNLGLHVFNERLYTLIIDGETVMSDIPFGTSDYTALCARVEDFLRQTVSELRLWPPEHRPSPRPGRRRQASQ